MNMYLPFGDWSDDGHGKYEKVLIEAPNMQFLRDAQIKIEECYGDRIWRGFAQEYDESTIDDTVQQALVDSGYPIERFAKYNNDIRYEQFNSLEELFESEFWDNEEWYVSLELVIDAFIWLLNDNGAFITRLEDYPSVCNWSCPGFRTVGYGCFLP